MPDICFSSQLEREFAEKYIYSGHIDGQDVERYIRLLGQSAIAELLHFMVANEVNHPVEFFNAGFRGRLTQIRAMPQGLQKDGASRNSNT